MGLRELALRPMASLEPDIELAPWGLQGLELPRMGSLVPALPSKGLLAPALRPMGLPERDSDWPSGLQARATKYVASIGQTNGEAVPPRFIFANYFFNERISNPGY